MSLRGEITNNLPVNADYQGIGSLRHLGDVPQAHLRRRERTLEGALDHPLAAKEPVQRFVAVLLSTANGYFHRSS